MAEILGTLRIGESKVVIGVTTAFLEGGGWDCGGGGAEASLTATGGSG